MCKLHVVFVEALLFESSYITPADTSYIFVPSPQLLAIAYKHKIVLSEHIHWLLVANSYFTGIACAV